jgi:hypothetical protein
MIATHNAASGSKLQYQIKKILNTKELQNAVNLLINWLHSGELRITYYHFMLVSDILQSSGIKNIQGDIGLKYIAAYLLLSKAEEIMNIGFEHSSYGMNQNVSDLVYEAAKESLENLDLLSSQLFASS